MAEAGWYPDPGGQHELRWFDGSDWTHEVLTRNEPTAESAHPAEAASPPDQDHAEVSTHFPAVPAAGWKLLLAFAALLTGAVLLPFASAGGEASAIASWASVSLTTPPTWRRRGERCSSASSW